MLAPDPVRPLGLCISWLPYLRVLNVEKVRLLQGLISRQKLCWVMKENLLLVRGYLRQSNAHTNIRSCICSHQTFRGAMMQDLLFILPGKDACSGMVNPLQVMLVRVIPHAAATDQLLT